MLAKYSIFKTTNAHIGSKFSSSEIEKEMKTKQRKFTLWGLRLSNVCTVYSMENDISWDFMIEKSEIVAAL